MQPCRPRHKALVLLFPSIGSTTRFVPLCLLFLCIAALSASAQERPGTPEVVTGGSRDTLIGGRPAARQGDTTNSGAAIVEGSKDVFINGKPAAVMGGKTICGGVVVGGGVFINSKPAARTGDPASGCSGK
jgi:uncharacterized Zn-binding protein involved in type VI secretion